MSYLSALALGVMLGLPIAVLGAATAQGRVGAAAMEGIARQPEAAGRIQTAMIIALALIEALVIYALLMFFVANGKMPAITADQATSVPALGSAEVAPGSAPATGPGGATLAR